MASPEMDNRRLGHSWHRSPDIWATESSGDGMSRRTSEGRRPSIVTTRRSPVVTTGNSSSSSIVGGASSVVGRRLACRLLTADDHCSRSSPRTAVGSTSSPLGRLRAAAAADDVMAVSLLSPDSAVSFVHDNAALAVTPDGLVGCSCTGFTTSVDYGSVTVRKSNYKRSVDAAVHLLRPLVYCLCSRTRAAGFLNVGMFASYALRKARATTEVFAAINRRPSETSSRNYCRRPTS